MQTRTCCLATHFGPQVGAGQRTHFMALSGLKWMKAAADLVYDNDATFESLAETGGFVIGYMRMWHHFLGLEQERTKSIEKEKRISVAANGITRQTRIDIEILVAAMLNAKCYADWRGVDILRSKYVSHFTC